MWKAQAVWFASVLAHVAVSLGWLTVAVISQRNLPYGGSDIFRLHLGTRQIEQLTFGEFTHPSAGPNGDLLAVWTPGPANDLKRPTTMPYDDATIAVNVDAAIPFLDVDGCGGVGVESDLVYISRRLLGLVAVPTSFRLLDPTIPSDEVVAAAVDALCPTGP